MCSRLVLLDEQLQRPRQPGGEQQKARHGGESRGEGTGAIRQPPHQVRSDEAAHRADRVDEREAARRGHAGQKARRNRPEDAARGVDPGQRHRHDR